VSAAQKKPPHIVFLFSDQQRWDTCGCYGQRLNVTPNLDRMAREGVRFEQAFTCPPVCGPARACLQTGKYAAADPARTALAGAVARRGLSANQRESTRTCHSHVPLEIQRPGAGCGRPGSLQRRLCRGLSLRFGGRPARAKQFGVGSAPGGSATRTGPNAPAPHARGPRGGTRIRSV
jgi:hypothetical protein